MALHVGPISDERTNLVMHWNRARIFEQIFHPPKISHRKNQLNNPGPVPIHYQIYLLIQNWLTTHTVVKVTLLQQGLILFCIFGDENNLNKSLIEKEVIY